MRWLLLTLGGDRFALGGDAGSYLINLGQARGILEEYTAAQIEPGHFLISRGTTLVKGKAAAVGTFA